MMDEKDKELEAISSIIGTLTPLHEDERITVLEYGLKRLEMATVHDPPGAKSDDAGVPVTSEANRCVVDIRSLTAEKQPRSATEMVALTAYCLSELAPEGERSETINTDAIRRYFKMAGFP